MFAELLNLRREPAPVQSVVMVASAPPSPVMIDSDGGEAQEAVAAPPPEKGDKSGKRKDRGDGVAKGKKSKAEGDKKKGGDADVGKKSKPEGDKKGKSGAAKAKGEGAKGTIKVPKGSKAGGGEKGEKVVKAAKVAAKPAGGEKKRGRPPKSEEAKKALLLSKSKPPSDGKRPRTGVDTMSNANFRRLAVLSGVRRVQGKEELFHRCKVLTKAQISAIVKNCVMLMKASKKTTLTVHHVLFEAKRQGHTMYWGADDAKASTASKKKETAATTEDAE